MWPDHIIFEGRCHGQLTNSFLCEWALIVRLIYYLGIRDRLNTNSNNIVECPRDDCLQEITPHHRLTPYNPMRQKIKDFLTSTSTSQTKFPSSLFTKKPPSSLPPSSIEITAQTPTGMANASQSNNAVSKSPPQTKSTIQVKYNSRIHMLKKQNTTTSTLPTTEPTSVVATVAETIENVPKEEPPMSTTTTESAPKSRSLSPISSKSDITSPKESASHERRRRRSHSSSSNRENSSRVSSRSRSTSSSSRSCLSKVSSKEIEQKSSSRSDSYSSRSSSRSRSPKTSLKPNERVQNLPTQNFYLPNQGFFNPQPASYMHQHPPPPSHHPSFMTNVGANFQTPNNRFLLFNKIIDSSNFFLLIFLRYNKLFLPRFLINEA